MSKTAKVIRVITIAPFIAFILINMLYINQFKVYNNVGDYLIAVFTLVILPILAYPVQSWFNIFPSDKRRGQRKLAIIFSASGYIIGFIASILLKMSPIMKVLFFTYLLSGIFIVVFNFVFKINASGHMCGLSGPIAMIVYLFGYWYVLLVIFLLFVVWSSLKLKRHRLSELFLGSVIPIVSLIISLYVFI